MLQKSLHGKPKSVFLDRNKFCKKVYIEKFLLSMYSNIGYMENEFIFYVLFDFFLQLNLFVEKLYIENKNRRLRPKRVT